MIILKNILKFIFPLLFTGRAPALLDSWDQAFLTAPLFVLLEILFFFGYRKKFYAKMMKQVQINIKKFNNQTNKSQDLGAAKSKKYKKKPKKM